MTVIEWVTLAIAAWGAVTGTISLLVQLVQHWNDRAILKLDAAMGVAQDFRRKQLCATFSISVHNAGRRIIRITKAGILMPSPPASVLPKGIKMQEAEISIFDSETAGKVVELEEGVSHEFMLSPFPMEIAKLFRDKELAFVQDTSGKQHKIRFATFKELPKIEDDPEEKPTNTA